MAGAHPVSDWQGTGLRLVPLFMIAGAYSFRSSWEGGMISRIRQLSIFATARPKLEIPEHSRKILMKLTTGTSSKTLPLRSVFRMFLTSCVFLFVEFPE